MGAVNVVMPQRTRHRILRESGSQHRSRLCFRAQYYYLKTYAAYTFESTIEGFHVSALEVVFSVPQSSKVHSAYQALHPREMVTVTQTLLID